MAIFMAIFMIMTMTMHVGSMNLQKVQGIINYKINTINCVLFLIILSCNYFNYFIL